MVSMSLESNGFQNFLLEFQKTVETGAQRLLSLPEQQTVESPDGGGWTRKEILGHLIDSAANNHQRFVRAQFTNDLVFPGYEQDKWVNAQRYNAEKWSQLVQLWKHYNLHLLHLASNIPSNVLTQPRTEHNLDQIAFRTVEKSQPTTLEYFIRDYAGHLRHHLSQIFAEDT
jgi:DinB superfamily